MLPRRPLKLQTHQIHIAPLQANMSSRHKQIVGTYLYITRYVINTQSRFLQKTQIRYPHPHRTIHAIQFRYFRIQLPTIHIRPIHTVIYRLIDLFPISETRIPQTYLPQSNPPAFFCHTPLSFPYLFLHTRTPSHQRVQKYPHIRHILLHIRPKMELRPRKHNFPYIECSPLPTERIRLHPHIPAI